MGQHKHSTHTKDASVEHTEPAIEQPSHDVHAHPWHKVLLDFGIILGVIVFVWGIGNLVLNRVSLGNLTFSARDSTSAITKSLQALTTSYQLAVSYPNGTTKSFSLSQTGITVDIPQTTDALKKQQFTPEHILTWWLTKPGTLRTQVDVAKLNDFIAQNIEIAEQPAHDAQLHISDGKVQITPGISGVGYSLQNPGQTIEYAVNHLQKTPLKVQKMTLAPRITEDSLQVVNNQVQAILAQQITIKIGSKTVSPSAADIGNWLTLTPSESTITVGTSQESVAQFINNAAKNAYQPARSQIVLDTTGQVIQAGERGFTAGSADDAIKTVTDAILQAKGATATVPVRYTAFDTVKAPTLGKWLEVNTATKRMYAYDQGQLVRILLVSAGAYGTPTVTGRFAIYSKYRSQDMRGANADGTGYYQPAVPYVNYFYRDYAIHGNYWRPASYFGAINSSHGCVGVPVSESAWIYNWAPIGTPVIVHT